MTNFTKTDFHFDGMFLTYGDDRRFVARFKHRGPITKARFVRLLVKFMTVEAYFAGLDAGQTPVGILEEAGLIWFDMTEKKFHFAG